jgi:hypothetical protein
MIHLTFLNELHWLALLESGTSADFTPKFIFRSSEIPENASSRAARLVSSARQLLRNWLPASNSRFAGFIFVLSSDQRAPQYSGQLLSPMFHTDNPPEQARQTGPFSIHW